MERSIRNLNICRSPFTLQTLTQKLARVLG